MSRVFDRLGLWLAQAGLVYCVCGAMAYAASSIADPGRFLNQTESLEIKDHPRFVRQLAEIHRDNPRLTRSERWHLRYLDAWETMFEGNFTRSASELHAVIDRSGDRTLVAKASALLLSNLGVSRHYNKAFELANHLMAELPTIADPKTRSMLLGNLSQMLDFAGQTDLAVKYARMMAREVPTGQSLCHPLFFEMAALYNGKRLTTSSPEFKRTIDACVAAGQPVFADATWLTLSEQYLDERKPAQALAILDRIAGSIRASNYFQSRLSAQVQQAMAYAQLGRDDKARQAALAAVAMCRPDYVSEWLMLAYKVLYQTAQKHGDTPATLKYFRRYVAQDRHHLDDVSARALAFALAQQHMLAQRLETERLSRQNRILRLRQALDAKAVENGRLYIALLCLALLFGGFWLFRLRRSQLRFKRLSHTDGLTGIFNHQHFMGEAGRVLLALKKKADGACLLFIDLDHFKRINDTHGHAAGDAVLKRAVAVCRAQLGPGDLLGRLGGEEFAILLPGYSRDRGAAVADRIRSAIEAAPVEDDGRIVSFSASVGLACTDSSGHDVQRLCRDADAALYRAKRSGRNRLIVDSENDDDLVEA